ncbi:signal peptidase I [Candidatus Wolfebacteria bacterium RIFCSPLOWO2_01_FULL_38_11]|uniref:Signal peptidase I n=2 Tax=Candidatus Wolfeibacteriota TaxID=1752735 RepID=A0A0G0G6P5_9BACT|nr:MAG: Signal peptidase I [Candidatus Wolfebacteria bacterium GW2011_GWC1_37_10]OGM92147.1 MAG: signal peptidase I [Candidatus Wolfebacteria bacterium RIFCSPLOWO2_01_FULL_38_11]
MKSLLYAIWETVEVALVAIVSVLIIRYFLIQPFLVNGASMEPNFRDGDYLLIDEVSYKFNKPERGEVIVFRYPGDESFFYIKRIIGLPNETIEISDGQIKISNAENPKGFTLEEKYLPFNLDTESKTRKISLKDNEYFVMGDNRNFSFDSRSWGPLEENEIIGLVRLRLWPLNTVMAFEKPIY